MNISRIVLALFLVVDEMFGLETQAAAKVRAGGQRVREELREAREFVKERVLMPLADRLIGPSVRAMEEAVKNLPWHTIR